MAVIRTLKDEQLIGGTSNQDVYPVTHIKAVFDSGGKSLDKIISDVSGYAVNLSSYVGYIVVDANRVPIRGTNIDYNVVTGNKNIVSDDYNVITHGYKLTTTIQVSKGDKPLPYSDKAKAGTFSAYIHAVGCKASLDNGVVTIMSIQNLENCYVEIAVDCEGIQIVIQRYSIDYIESRENNSEEIKALKEEISKLKQLIINSGIIIE